MSARPALVVAVAWLAAIAGAVGLVFAATARVGLTGNGASFSLVLQGPLGSITGGDTVAVAASTLATAALFQSIRRRIQTAVDHRFNRARSDAEQTIDALATRLRDVMDLPVVRSAVVDAVARSVEPTGASLWLRPGRLP